MSGEAKRRRAAGLGPRGVEDPSSRAARMDPIGHARATGALPPIKHTRTSALRTRAALAAMAAQMAAEEES